MPFTTRPLASALASLLALAAVQQAAQAQVSTKLEEIRVTAEQPEVGSEAQLGSPVRLSGAQLETDRAATSDTARLLLRAPGVSLQGAGGVSSLPVIRGLADDRLRISIDGMDLIASCPNHMNPPLSYLDPSAVDALDVYAGITPVSLAGDQIGGTILAETAAPLFARPGESVHVEGQIGARYRSNGNAYSINLGATAANEDFSIRYSGAQAQSDNIKAGGDFKTSTLTGRAGHGLPLDEVGSTAYETRNHSLDLAWRQDNHLIQAQIGYQDLPEQLYPNQRMDLLNNEAKRFNLSYLGAFYWGRLDAQAYYETVDHFMDFGADKRFWYGMASGVPNGMMDPVGKSCAPIGPMCAAGMPMYSESNTLGLKLKGELDLSQTQLLRLGTEYQRYRLQDYWTPSGAGMWPGTFENINDGQRDRLALFAEWEAKPAPQWQTLLGVRYERVSMDAGEARAYNTASPTNDEAVAFNAEDHQRTDHNLNLTALARYQLDATKAIEFGYAHLTRSPSLYERYTWSTWAMAASMNNTVGDGNGYVGDIDLKPEQANTLALTYDWRSLNQDWHLKATPYLTRVDDYIDAVPATSTWQPDQFNVLKYANQDAELYGIDIAATAPLGQSNWGRFGLEGLLNYTRGKNRDTGDGLYNIMPPNLTLTLTQQHGGWDNAIEVILVDSKDHLSSVRNEMPTASYSLVTLRGSYSWPRLRLDFGIENLFDRLYDQPLGGAYLGQGRTMMLNPTDGTLAWGTPVPGPGRSFYIGMNYRF